MLYALVGQGVTVVNSTAYLDEAERCHRVALLHHGRLLFCDTPARLKSRMPGAVVSIVSTEARRVRDQLGRCRAVLRAQYWSATRFICLSMTPSGEFRNSARG